MDSDMLLMLAPVLVLQIGLQIYALVDLYKHRGGKPPLGWWWAAVIVVLNLLGPIAYFVAGRKEDCQRPPAEGREHE